MRTTLWTIGGLLGTAVAPIAAKLALKIMPAPSMPLLSPEMTEEAQRKGDCAKLLDQVMDGKPADGG